VRSLQVVGRDLLDRGDHRLEVRRVVLLRKHRDRGRERNVGDA
jgi:hypothetical protein